MNKKELIQAITDRNLAGLKALVEGLDKTILIGSNGCYLGTSVQADRGLLAREGCLYIQFIARENTDAEHAQ